LDDAGSGFQGGAQERQRRRGDLHRGIVHRHRDHRRRSAQLAVVLLLLIAAASGAEAQRRPSNDRYDDIFRKYSKRYFGPGFDWRYFKAQGIAESGLDPNATSWVGARGIMQLMPSTYRHIQSARPDLGRIDDPEWNIAAGVMHDRYLWRLWKEQDAADQRCNFMFGSYNAGEGTIRRALREARAQQLDHRSWTSIETVAPRVQRWRYRETLGYVRKIRATHLQLRRAPKGRDRFATVAPPDSAISPVP
jgi:membrane-bound lytic murein transglycosylase F